MTTKSKLSRIWGRVRESRILVFGDLISENYRWLDQNGDCAASTSRPAASHEVRPSGAAAVGALAASLDGSDEKIGEPQFQ